MSPRRPTRPRALGALLAAATLAAPGCRADPGYSSHVGLRGVDAGVARNGHDPYVAGERRLAVGLFYEGGASETVPIDGVGTHYYIFQLEGSARLTYTQETSDDRLEGALSARLVLEGTPWWGGGIIWDMPRRLSGYTTVSVTAKSEDPGLSEVFLRLQSGTPAQETSVALSAYGYAADGAWHPCDVPLADLVAAGFDPSAVRSPFILGGAGGRSGESLLVDDVYWDAD